MCPKTLRCAALRCAAIRQLTTVVGGANTHLYEWENFAVHEVACIAYDALDGLMCTERHHCT